MPKLNATEEKAAKPERLSPNYRWALTGVLIANAILALLYRSLSLEGLEQTSALFIGLPVVLGLLIVHLSRARSNYGAVLRGNLIFLCVVSPLLGEGSLCLLMAAPIFIAVSLAITGIVSKTGKHAGWILVLVLPFMMGLDEREANLNGKNIQTVSTVLLRPGTVQDWVGRTQRAATPAATENAFLKLGFPLPEAYRIDRGVATVSFSLSEGVRGPWTAKVSPAPDGVRFEVLRDQSKLAHWLRVMDSEVHVSQAGPGMVRVEQSTRFQPLLHPLWYFVPPQTYAVRQMHVICADTWAGKP
jgi:hypothetical protein